MSLQNLGLTPEQENLYRYLLRTPRADPTVAETELGIGVRMVLDELRALGLVDELLLPLPPAAAVDVLVRRRMEQASRELARMDAAFDVVRDLAEEARRGRAVELVERLPDGLEVNRRVSAMLDRSETMHAKPLPRSVTYSDEYARRYRRQLADGLVSRTIIGTAALDLPEQLAYARQMHSLGDLHRVSAEPYLPLLIIDRRVAFVRVVPGKPSVEAPTLMIRQPGIVAVLVELFDGLWSRAADLDGLELTATEARVLRALAEHSKDETAARAMNMSLRKYRTHVADLMSRLGASSRFQAALRAKERGWL
ncbi:LuxR C-terminal-related transcriptional regulator [Streptomyces sp. NPDC046931]|uniref:helix-turn-helix transcriptional regulator n=1 Tax=Streptomyces sp. NPDC046931 TaxID=3154806 RepID=UPI0033C15999